MTKWQEALLILLIFCLIICNYWAYCQFRKQNLRVSDYRTSCYWFFLFLSHLIFFFLSRLGVQLLALLVPTLISYLLNENAFASASTASKDLHEFALQNLMHIGPLYPHAFKTVMGAAPELKTRLETAVRASQASKAKAAARQPPPTVHSTPTIKLKTSFFWITCIIFGPLNCLKHYIIPDVLHIPVLHISL